MLLRLNKIFRPSTQLFTFRKFSTMEVKPETQEETVKDKLDKIHATIQKAVEESERTATCRLVSVTKRIKKDLVHQAYDQGERHFGENYFQSLKRRSTKLPSDIKWHFIGHLQSNKANGLVAIENLHVIETVDSIKLARKLNNACSKASKTLNIFLQVNSSGEASKSGFPPEETLGIADTVMEECTNLKLTGLMSIGKVGCREGFELMYKLKQDI